jgi:malate synthase
MTATKYDLELRAEGRLQVALALDAFVGDDLLRPLSIDPDDFWAGLADIVDELLPRNLALLERRRVLQDALDAWHADHRGAGDRDEYVSFLEETGYLEPVPDESDIRVEGVDPEIAVVAGPQLVVPLSIPRYALNAANARWGSLYDALYGTDVIGEDAGASRTAAYNPTRGDRVIEYTNGLLDEVIPLAHGRHADAVGYAVSAGPPHELEVTLAGGTTTSLADPSQFAGFRRNEQRTIVVLRHHDLHVQLVVDRDHPVGSQHRAGVADVVLEAAVTTIQDCEDSVAAVDAEDKVAVYRAWLGLMTGALEAAFDKAGDRVIRQLRPDEEFTAPDGAALVLPGRSLMLVRNVGIHMMTDAVRTSDGREVPEGIVDAAITVAAALHDLRRLGRCRNSRTGSVYVVKPKLHGSDEVAFTVDLFAAVEALLGLPANTVKIGIMDEERRTSLNLAACVAAARERVIFINTGFLDRTGDEIHTLRAAGPVVRKGDMRTSAWLTAYEDHNVDVGLAAGFSGRAQIGKGMWAMPDEMKAMVDSKIGHPRAGATCAWVPSPTAATLHAMHYHSVDVAARQRELGPRRPTSREAMLEVPLLATGLSEDDIDEELANNAQGVLGYVVRWVEHGVGCSKVPDIHNVALMEDRATLRISSQHIANWLRHGIVDEQRIRDAFLRMAVVVDEQNADDPAYVPMAVDPERSAAFSAALELVLDGFDAPNGYTEPVLHRWRRHVKAAGRT